MQNQVQKLNPESITSDVYIIAPTQIEYIAHIFGNTVADTMNMRPFAQKIRQIAEQSLRLALQSAKHMGEKK
jgi:ligand-binding sensor protein